MTDYRFTKVLVWDNVGGNVRLARNQRVDVTDPTTGAVAAGLKVSGQPVSYLTSDANGHVDFTSTQGLVRITSQSALWQDVESPDLRVNAVQAGVDASNAAASAATAASAASASSLDAAAARTAAQAAVSGINTADVGYDVILLAGQSNMSGRGAGYDNAKLDPIDPRIYQYGNSGSLANKISLAIEPLLMHDTPSGMGPGLQFARWYSQTLPANRRILLVPVAHGGTGFRTSTVTPTPSGYVSAGGTWEVGGAGVNLYENAITQANAAISAAGANSRIVAVLWLQGESDTNLLDQNGYAAQLDALIDGFRSRITGASTVPFILGQMLPEQTSSVQSWKVINSAHVDTPRRKTRAAYAYGLAGANNGDGLHYNADGQRFMGRSMFDAFPLAVANVTGTAPVAPGALTFSQSGTSVKVSWVRPACRVTGYTVQYRATGSTSWLSAPAGTNALDNFATVTGLTLGAGYDFQVATVNEQGTSAFTGAPFTLAGLLAAPTGIAGTGSGGSIAVTWNAVSGATSYFVEYKASSSGTWLSGPTSTLASANVTGLTPSTNYDIRVSTINAAGTGSASAPVTVNSATAGPSLLDAITAAPARAYSLRRLKSTYGGYAIRVRRASDSTESDIGFSGNDLDTAALTSFASGGDVFIKTWYDQSGNARNLTQATAANQAKIVAAGTVQAIGSRSAASFTSSFYSDSSPSLYAAGAASMLTVLSAPAATGATTPYVVSESSTSSGSPQYTLLAETSTSPYNAGIIFARSDTNATVEGSTSATTGPNIWTGSVHQVSAVDTGTLGSHYVDGAAGYTTGAYTRTGTLTLNTFTIGALVRTSTGQQFTGLLPEIVLWTSALSTADRQAGESNQKAYYGTP